MAPSKMAEKDQAIKQNRSKYDKLIELKPVKDFVSQELSSRFLKFLIRFTNDDLSKLVETLRPI